MRFIGTCHPAAPARAGQRNVLWPVSPLPPVARSSIRRLLQRCGLSRISWSPLRRLLVDQIIRYVFMAAYLGWCVARSSSSGILLASSRRRWSPTVGEPGRQPFCEADQDQHYRSAPEHYAEEDKTCRQVRMGRQVFAEPPGAPSVCRITRHSIGPALQEPDGGCEHDGGTDDHKEAGESFLSARYHAHGQSPPSSVRENHPGLVVFHPQPVPSSMSGRIAARYSSCSAMCCSRLLA